MATEPVSIAVSDTWESHWASYHSSDASRRGMHLYERTAQPCQT